MQTDHIKFEKILNKFVGIVDFCLLNLSVFIAYTLRTYIIKLLIYMNFNYIVKLHLSPILYPTSVYIEVSILYSVIVLIIFNSFKLYEKRKTLNRLDEAFSLVKAIILGTAIIIGICYMIGWFKFSRSILILMMFFSIIMIITWRLIIRSIELMLIRRGVGAGRILLYGAGKAGKMIADEIRLHTSRGDAIVGFIDDDRTKLGDMVVNSLKVLGTRQDIPEIVQKNEVNEIIISMPSASNKRLLEISLFLKKHNIPFKIMPDVFDLITSKVNTVQIGSITLFELKESPLTPGKRLLKRVFDLIIATVLLVLSTPFWLPIIIAIKFTSKGPIFFIQERVKENGEIFQMYKFRTMVENAEKMRKDLEKYNLSDGPIFIMKNDPRITNIGELLRKTSLDEIPQLINVIKGDMTLVGPRPPIPAELEEYKQWHFKRITVPQGMTGLWQVSGRSDLSFNEMVKLDIYYIENWSLWLDLKIFLRTIPSVLFMKGAY